MFSQGWKDGPVEYHSYWHSAEKKAYSGVAILSRINPERVVVGMERKEYDLEGRVIRVDLGDLTILNVYFPSGTAGDTRQAFKMKFLEDLMIFVNSLREETKALSVRRLQHCPQTGGY